MQSYFGLRSGLICTVSLSVGDAFVLRRGNSVAEVVGPGLWRHGGGGQCGSAWSLASHTL